MNARHLLTASIVVLALTACGNAPSQVETAAKAKADRTQACRQSWAGLRTLDKQYVARPDVPSALASRWDTMQATIAYYVVNATDDDCGDLIDKQRSGMESLSALGVSLRKFDMAYQLGRAEAELGNYLQTHKLHNLGGALTGAFVALRANAPVADSDTAPAYQALNKIDLNDPDQVTAGIHDVRFLAKGSSAFKVCKQALKIIDQAFSGKPAEPDSPESTDSPSEESSPAAN